MSINTVLNKSWPILIVLAIVGYIFVFRISNDQEINTDPTTDFHAYAESCIDIVSQVFGENLAYDEESIRKLDSIIDEGWVTPTEVDETTIDSFGAFLGEATIAVNGGKWVETKNGWVVELNGIQFQPFNLVEQRFTQGGSNPIILGYFMFQVKATGIDSDGDEYPYEMK